MVLVVCHIKHDSGKKWMTAGRQTGVQVHEPGGGNAQGLFQPEDIKGVQIEFKLPAAVGKARDSGMTCKPKGGVTHKGSAFRDQIWRNSLVTHILSKKKLI